MCGSRRDRQHHHPWSNFAPVTLRNRAPFRAKYSETAPLLHQSSEHFAWVEFQHASEIEELDHIDPTLTDLDARDDGLGRPEARRELVLRELLSFASRDEHGRQGAMTRAAKTLHVRCSRLRARTYNAKIDLGDF